MSVPTAAVNWNWCAGSVSLSLDGEPPPFAVRSRRFFDTSGICRKEIYPDMTQHAWKPSI
jgi:hypothetical protein